MITRGTTPYHSFILPVMKEDIEELWITYCQNENIIFERQWTSESDDERLEIINLLELYENASMGEEGLSEEEKTWSQLTVHLTQEETLGFKFWPAARKNIAIIQIRFVTVDGEAYGSDPVAERIFGVRHDGVIGFNKEEPEEELNG